jgi:hypothetical protein
VNLFGGKSLPAPEPATGGSCRGAVLFENLQQLLDVGATEPLLVFERQLEEPCLQVAREQEKVVGVDQAFFGIRAEELLGMADYELVERRARRDEHADGPRPPPGTSQLLPRRRDGPRVPDQHGRLQAADVDA